MARQNYGFNKRQREIAKKQKREEKLQRRQERKAAAATGEGEGGPPILEAPPEQFEVPDDSQDEETEPMEIRVEES
ncbi:MAG: hypothetical protein H6511_07840 [Holophagales bacterium]|nr:hypothetical protein [Holophagales bacterium]